MNERPLSSPRLLIVDDESDLRLFLQDLLLEEGYAVDIGATLDEALTLIDAHVYHLILTDLLMHSTTAPLRSALAIHARARPTPVMALTGWNVSPAEVARAGLARLIAKPFDLTDLLAVIAASVETRLSAGQQRQAETLRHFCDAFNAGALDATPIFADDVRLYPPHEPLGESEPVIAGRTSCLAYLERVRRARPDLRLEDCLIFPHPGGLALRYLKSWSAPDAPSGRASLACALAVQFNGERISQINMLTRGPSWDAFPPPPTDTLTDGQDCSD